MKKFRNLKLLILLTCTPMCFGQDLIIQQNDHQQVLYRGFRNSFAVSLESIPFNDLNFTCSNCAILSQSDGTIIISPGNSKTAELIVSSKSNPAKEFKQVFRVQNLPNPQVFIGNKENGSKISFDELKNAITIGYDNCLLLKGNFEVIAWELSKDGLKVSGTEDKLNEKAIELLQTGKSTEFTLKAITLCKSDGITRELVANFIVQ